METRLCWKDESRSASWDVIHVLWNLKCHYCLHKNRSLKSTLYHLKPVHNKRTISLWISMILFSHLRLGLQVSLLKLPYAFISLHVTCPSLLVSVPSNILCRTSFMLLIITQIPSASYYSACILLSLYHI